MELTHRKTELKSGGTCRTTQLRRDLPGGDYVRTEVARFFNPDGSPNFTKYRDYGSENGGRWSHSETVHANGRA